MFEKNENLLGLDIGSSSVKVVRINAKQTPLKLLDCGLIPISGEAVSEGRVINPEMVAAPVQRLLSNLKIKAKSVAASISGYEVMIKNIELPSMAEEELHNRMQSELGQYIPYNIEEVDVDYQVLDLSKDRPNHMEVLLVAAKKESVREHVNLVRHCGLDLTVVDVDYFALSNAFEATYGITKENVALIDIGASKGIIHILSQGVSVFRRGISIGGHQIDERIQERFGISPDDAQKVKLGEQVKGVTKEDLSAIFISVVRSWVNECRRAIDFYYSNFPEKSIDKIFLSGGSCRIPGLEKTFEENLGSVVEIFNPFKKIEADSKTFDQAYLEYMGPQMAIALGLALRRAKEK